MEPTTLLYIGALLACPLGMGLMMWLMHRNMGGQQDHGMSSPGSQVERLKALREQRHHLEQEIAETEKIATLEAKKESLAR